MNKYFKNISKLLEGVGEQIDNVALDFIEGMIETGRSSIQLVDKLVFNGSGKVFNILQLISIRRTIVKSLYPTYRLENKLKDNPERIDLLLELFELQERQFRFSLKLLRLVSITPFSYQMKEKTSEYIKQQREISSFLKERDKTLTLALETLSKDLDSALEEDDLDKIRNSLVLVLKCKLLIKDHNNFMQWLQLSKDLFELSKWAHINGIYLMQQQDYFAAAKQLKVAYEQGSPYADDDLLECIELGIKYSKDEQEKKYFSNLRSEMFPYFASQEFVDRFLNLPVHFLFVKKAEIEMILAKGVKNEKG